MQNIKNYLWFINESQSFMAGHNKTKVFLLSLVKGFGFVRSCNRYNRYAKKYGALAAYVDLCH